MWDTWQIRTNTRVMLIWTNYPNLDTIQMNFIVALMCQRMWLNLQIYLSCYSITFLCTYVYVLGFHCPCIFFFFSIQTKMVIDLHQHQNTLDLILYKTDDCLSNILFYWHLPCEITILEWNFPFLAEPSENQNLPHLSYMNLPHFIHVPYVAIPI